MVIFHSYVSLPEGTMASPAFSTSLQRQRHQEHFIPEPSEPSETIVGTDPGVCEKDIFARKAGNDSERFGTMSMDLFQGKFQGKTPYPLVN